MYLPYATSLRMGRLGYQSDAQASLAVSYNGLQGYGDSLHSALTLPYPAYEAIGVQGTDGEYRQLATSLLQIENEFYGTIRPKRVIHAGERPLHALRERGVEYVEVRLMDLNPFEPLGISAQTMRFLDVFLAYCLLSDSPPDTPAEIAAIAANQQRVAERGRESGLQLQRGGSEISLAAWGNDLVQAMEPIALQFDTAHGTTDYMVALQAAKLGLAQPETLPSARVVQTIESEYGGSFVAFARAQSERTKNAMLEVPLPDSVRTRLEAQSATSIQEQQDIEAADSMPFDVYLREYLSPARLGV
jgi:glutamate--cysteine ligase